MTGKLIRRMLAAQVMSAMAVSLCLLIDNVVINRFLGVTAVAAYELANPVLLAIGAVASVLAAGVQVACSKSLGSGSQEETDKGYSTAIAMGVSISLVFTVLVLLFRGAIASAVGADSSPELYKQTKDYLAGFVIGALPTMAALSLLPFLQMAGKSGLLIVAVLGMTVTDVGLDLLNVYVLHMDMYGMGLASSISYYVALIIALTYFLSKKCVFHFSTKLVSLKKARELIMGGVPGAFTALSGVVLVFVLNHLLLGKGGENAVAAYAIVSGILNASNSVSTGVNGVTLTLTGILFSEEDRKGLMDLLKILFRYALILGAGACAVFVALAPAIVGVFLENDGPVREMAVVGVRLTSLGLLPCCVVNLVKSFYQGTERIPQMGITGVLECAIMPMISALVLSSVMGINGIWLYFAIGEVLTLVCVFIYGYIQHRRGENPVLPDSFGIQEGNALEEEIRDMKSAMEVSRKAEQFCIEHGQEENFAKRIALCIEEMAGNTVKHGFQEGRDNRLSVRVQCKGKEWILRFRDDCKAFDPVKYIPKAEGEGLGIRLVMGMAADVRYTYTLNLNNLTIVLTKKEEDEGTKRSSRRKGKGFRIIERILRRRRGRTEGTKADEKKRR